MEFVRLYLSQIFAEHDGSGKHAGNPLIRLLKERGMTKGELDLVTRYSSPTLREQLKERPNLFATLIGNALMDPLRKFSNIYKISEEDRKAIRDVLLRSCILQLAMLEANITTACLLADIDPGFLDPDFDFIAHRKCINAHVTLGPDAAGFLSDQLNVAEYLSLIKKRYLTEMIADVSSLFNVSPSIIKDRIQAQQASWAADKIKGYEFICPFPEEKWRLVSSPNASGAETLLYDKRL